MKHRLNGTWSFSINPSCVPIDISYFSTTTSRFLQSHSRLNNTATLTSISATMTGSRPLISEWLPYLISDLDEKRNLGYPDPEDDEIWANHMTVTDSLIENADYLAREPIFRYMAAANQTHQHFLLYWHKLEGLILVWTSETTSRDQWEADKRELGLIIDAIGNAVADVPVL